MSKTPADYFDLEAARSYDQRNRALAPIAAAMHFLIRLALKDLPARSRALCVGVGTGAELLSLAQAHPEWTFVALDPSQSMLDICRERAKAAGVESRCEFVHGYVHDLPAGGNYDVALSVLVGHFVKREERLAFYQNLTSRLKPGGYLVNTEISFDLDSKESPSMVDCWKAVQTLMGATPESLAALPNVLREMLTVLAPNRTEELIRQSGIAIPVRFYQAFMICGWYGQKS